MLQSKSLTSGSTGWGDELVDLCFHGYMMAKIQIKTLPILRNTAILAGAVILTFICYFPIVTQAFLFHSLFRQLMCCMVALLWIFLIYRELRTDNLTRMNYIRLSLLTALLGLNLALGTGLAKMYEFLRQTPFFDYGHYSLQTCAQANRLEDQGAQLAFVGGFLESAPVFVLTVWLIVTCALYVTIKTRGKTKALQQPHP